MIKEWNLDPSLIYLNHAAMGPWPVRTEQAISRFAKQNTWQGSMNYLEWLKVETRLRENLARMINAPDTDSIALAHNTSEALSIVAYGLTFNAGDNIVISNQEFPSNRIVWDSLKSQNVSLTQVDLYSAETPEQALINACNSGTRLLSISSVQFASGIKLNLKTLGDYCLKNKILFCVDAIQSVGVDTLDVQDCHIDFLAADGHKWMLAPEGLGVFYCRKELIKKLKLNRYGWHMMENMTNYDSQQWQPASTARRFECGSPNLLGIHALEASTSLLLEVGLETVKNLVQTKINYLFDELNVIPHIEVITPKDAEQRLGIISFRSRQKESEAIFKHLTDNNVFCALRSGNVRLSPHYYTPDKHLETVITLIKNLTG